MFMIFDILPYELITLLFDYLDDLNKKNLFKSFNKNIYQKAIESNYKIKLYDRYIPNKIINNKLFMANKFIIYCKENMCDLEPCQQMDILFANRFNEKLCIISKSNISAWNSITHLTFGNDFNQKLENLSQ